MTEYIALNGGEDKFLHHGGKITQEIEATLSFSSVVDGYSFILKKGDDGLVFTNEYIVWRNNKGINIASTKKEAEIKWTFTDNSRAYYVRRYLEGLKKYHFHDTGKNAPFNKTSHILNDKYF